MAKGIDPERVTEWFRGAVPTLDEPLSFDLVAHGRSNLTFVVSDAAGRRWVLRRPPTGHVLQSAHDMSREHKIIKALGPTDVAVPGVVGLCEDNDVNDAPFYVMEFVEGTIHRDWRAIDAPAIRRSLIEMLVRLHSVDPDAVGLGDLGRKEGYLTRQLKRWRTQIETGSDRELKGLKAVGEMLERRMPEQHGAGIVHGDYRLDNCMIADDGSVAAVLDWELCTLGDVLADVGGFLMYMGWRPGAPGGDEVIETYAEMSGRKPESVPYYVAFANWRLACIVEGVRTRFEKGAMGDKDIGPELAAYTARVDAGADLAREILEEAT